MSMFQPPVAPEASVSASARFSHSAWKTGSSVSGTTGPKPMPPMSCGPFSCAASGREAGADHGVAGDEPGEALLAPAFGAGGPLGTTR